MEPIINNWQDMPEVLSLEYVSLIFDVKQSTIRQWVKRGNIVPTKLGTSNRLYFSKEYIKSLFHYEADKYGP